MTQVFDAFEISEFITGSGINSRTPVRVATTVSGTLTSDFENGDVVDGVTLATNDRILIKNQVSIAENGIYTVNATGQPTRSIDMPNGENILSTLTWVKEGSVNSVTGWVGSGTINSNAIFTRYDVSDTLTVARGGTGTTSFTNNAVLTGGSTIQSSPATINTNGDLVLSGTSAYIQLPDVTAPTNPGAGEGRLYKKTSDDGLFWKPDATGPEIDLTNTSPGQVLYDAIVDVAGGADFTSIAAAFVAGNQSVFVRDGVYPETADVVMNSNSRLIGESAGVIIDFSAGSFGVNIDGSGGTTETAGTIDVTNGSTTVSGTGTTFTNLNPIGTNTAITIGASCYIISAITNDTTLVLEDAYNGDTKTGQNYIAQQIVESVVISNVKIVNSGSSGLFARALATSNLSNILISDCDTGVSIEQCCNNVCENISSFDCSTQGFIITDSSTCILSNCQAVNCGSDGFQVGGTSGNILINTCNGSNNDIHGLDIVGTSVDILVTESVFNYNNLNGINTGPSSTSFSASNCTFSNNGQDGIDFDSNDNIVSGCIISNNGRYGIQGNSQGTVNGCQIFNNVDNNINIEVDLRCVISGNAIYDGNSNGISISTSSNDNNIMANLIFNNAGSGVIIDATSVSNLISSNRIQDNTVNGVTITASSSNLVIGNHISGSTIGISVSGVSDESNISNNIIINNSSDGINLNSDRCVISGNRCASNGGDGCVIGAGSTDCTIISNNFQNNTGVNLSDSSTITGLEPLLIQRVDTRTAATLQLGDTIATKIELADTNVVTEVQGDLDALANINLSGYTQFSDITAPANPGAGEGRLYKKTSDDGLFWLPDATGAEVDLTELANSIATSTTTTSTTSATYVVINAMSITPAEGTYLVTFSASGGTSANSATANFAIFVDGSIVQHTERSMIHGAFIFGSVRNVMHTQTITTVNGSQSIDVRYTRNAGTFQVFERNLILVKLA